MQPRSQDKCCCKLELAQDLLNRVPFFAILLDRDDAIIWLNKEAEKVFGVRREQVKGKIVWDEVLAGQDESVRADAASHLGAGITWKKELLIAGRDGRKLVIQVTVTMLDNIGSSDLGEGTSLFIGRDVTKDRSERRHEIQVEKMATRGEMAGEIAHELNNYLSIVCGNLELIGMSIDRKMYDGLPARMKSMIDGVERIRKFVEGLMYIAKPDRRWEIFDIHRFLENELFFLEAQPQFAGIDFKRNWGPDLPPIEADCRQLQQALYNVLMNAVEALKDRPSGEKRITLTTSFKPHDGTIRLEIFDNGCGMKDEDYGKVFRQHFTTKGTGHGFGLLAVKQAIKPNGGKVSASRGPDGGACIVLELPVRSSTAESKTVKFPV